METIPSLQKLIITTTTTSNQYKVKPPQLLCFVQNVKIRLLAADE